MDIVTYQYKNYLWIQIPEELDHLTSDIIRSKCEIILLDSKFKHIVFDFSKTQFMDSAGIGMIMGRYRQIHVRGGKMYAFNPGKRIIRLIEISGLMRLMRVVNTMEQLEMEE